MRFVDAERDVPGSMAGKGRGIELRGKRDEVDGYVTESGLGSLSHGKPVAQRGV